jgi:beclin 1
VDYDGKKPLTIPSAAHSAQAHTKSTILELFSSGDLPLGKQLLHRRFNEAMVAFLECLKQLCDHIRASTSKAHGADAIMLPPYKIERDRINGVSIKLGVSQDEAWTTACKYTLTCCKFLLAHISNVCLTSYHCTACLTCTDTFPR